MKELSMFSDKQPAYAGTNPDPILIMSVIANVVKTNKLETNMIYAYLWGSDKRTVFCAIEGPGEKIKLIEDRMFTLEKILQITDKVNNKTHKIYWYNETKVGFGAAK